MEKEIKICALQMNSKLGDKQANFEHVKCLLERDINCDVDIIILPEVFAIGWSCDLFRENSEDINDSETLNFVSEIAAKYNANVIGGSFIEKKNGEYYNTCPVVNRNGELLATYRKIHLFDYFGNDEGKYITKGDSPVMVNIEGTNVGLTICYDIRFPEIYRAYRKAGADLLVNVAAWGLHKPIPWEIMTRSRGIENQAYMVALTQCGHIKDEEWNIGHSRIIDYKGLVISEIKDQQEGIMYAVINLDEMYKFRQDCTILKDISDSYEVEVK